MNVNRSIVMVAVVAGLLGNLPAQEPDKNRDEPSVWMKKKLEYSQGILEGLSAGDFDQIAKNAESMQTLNNVERFVRGRTPRYRTQLELFQDANEELLRAANADNLEGVTLAFNQLTISCVKCHKELRRIERK
jgi:hypothetical protein